MSKRILVVGASTGIGMETVRWLVEQGHQVQVATRDGAFLQEWGVTVQSYDVLQGDALEVPESLDGLVYAPGSIQLKPFHRLSDEDFLQDFQLNCLGAVRVLRAAMPALKAAESASIVLFSTVAVAQGMPFHASIAAAKGAIEGLTRSLAAEWAPKIRVNAIAPSLTDTPLAEHLLNSEAKREAASKRHPLQQIGNASDVAALVGYLLSDASRFMSGQVLRPDGGLSSLRTL